MNSYNLFKALAFSFDPEVVHHQSISLLKRFPALMYSLSPQYSHTIDMSVQLNCGLEFPYPVGLAAGLDKNAECIDYFSRLPFGALEVGTITPRPQSGNPKPRLFRLIEEKSLLNRMGFNNIGMDEALKNIHRCKKREIPLGLNLGKNKTSTDASADYKVLYQHFAPVSDYLVVNVSSPNTPGLRDLQQVDSLREIIQELLSVREECQKPLFIKISPDMSFDDVPPIVELASAEKLAGIIATNTTINKDIGVGGVSGALVKEKARSMRKHVMDVVGKSSSLDVIGVGGVDSAQEVLEFWSQGGRFMQLYSSFIFQGPAVLHRIYDDLVVVMKEKGFSSFEELRQSLS